MYPHVVSGSPVFHVGQFVCDGSDTVRADKQGSIISELSHCILVMSWVEVGSLHYIRRRTNAGSLDDTCINPGYKGCSILIWAGRPIMINSVSEGLRQRRLDYIHREIWFTQ